MGRIYRISNTIFDKYPYFSRGVILAWEADNTSSFTESLYALLTAKMDYIRNSGIEYENHPKIVSWKDAYAGMGVNIKKVKPSVLALIERIMKGVNIPFISPLVCISNLVSLEYLNPGGLVDADQLKGNPSLDFAKGNEIFLPFGSEKEVHPVPGEIIYYDDTTKRVMCGGWNSKGGQDTMIKKATSRIILDVDTFTTNESSTNDLNDAVYFAESLIRKYCVAQTTSFILNRDNRESIISMN
jgi:DNA/RNA-binding domain of Phe-tRNA-synthetase-like protein